MDENTKGNESPPATESQPAKPAEILPEASGYQCNCGEVFPHPMDRLVHAGGCESMKGFGKPPAVRAFMIFGLAELMIGRMLGKR